MEVMESMETFLMILLLWCYNDYDNISNNSNSKNINTRIVQIIGTSGFIIMCVCTPLWGVLADKINFRFLLLILNIASATLSYLYYLSIFNDISFLIATLSYLL